MRLRCLLTCQNIPQRFVGDRFTPKNVNLEVVPFVYHNVACMKLVQVFQWYLFFFFPWPSHPTLHCFFKVFGLFSQWGIVKLMPRWDECTNPMCYTFASGVICLSWPLLYTDISLSLSDFLHVMMLGIWYTLTVLIERKQPTSLIS